MTSGMTSGKKIVRIGNAGGYWGDDPFALARQVNGGKLDYITIDFLAEITMSILKKQHAKDQTKGYAHDFITMLEPVLPKLIENKTKLITNAGGINPKACAAKIHELAKKLGLKVSVAVVYGDDIASELSKLEDKGAKFINMETSESFDQVRTKIQAANVYFGAYPVVKALEKWNPDIIITGRVTDTGITLAPMIYEFGWSLNDWDKLASGIVAGHIIECGSQATGGNFTDWHKVPSFDDMGYPIVEINSDGTFVVTKHPKSGGLVSVDTVREQLFYEMGEPCAYITPDVVADFSSIKLEQKEENRVFVYNVKGREPTRFYKVSMAFEDGYKASGSIIISGPSARKKAERFSEIFWNKLKGRAWEDQLTEYVGWNALHRSLSLEKETSEILLRLSAKARDQDSLNVFTKLIPSLILSGPAGVAVLGGVAKPQQVISYWPALLDKDLVQPRIALYDDQMLREENVLYESISGNFAPQAASSQAAHLATKSLQHFLDEQKNYSKTLYDICLARSGDKGDTVNIGLCARTPEAYAWIREHITAAYVKNCFQELCLGSVVRYELNHLMGLNFLLEHSLGGGGSCTLRADAQGKTFAQALLKQKVFF